MFVGETVSFARKCLVAAAFAFSIASNLSPAHAAPLSVGETIAVSYDRPFFLLPDLKTTIDLTVESLTNNQIVLGVAIDNTTSPWFLTSHLTSIGWNTNILPTGATETSTAYNLRLVPTTDSIDLTSSRYGGLRPTRNELFTLTLVGNFASGTPDFSNFTATFGTIIGSFTAHGTMTTTGSSGGTGSDTSGTGGSVPEPSTLSIAGAALLAAFAYRLRQVRTLQPARVKRHR